MPAPPSEAGAVHDRVTRPLPAVAVRPVGGPGFSTVACGTCMAVRTTDTPGSDARAGDPAAPGPATMPTASIGQPAMTAARHAPTRRKGFIKTPAGVVSLTRVQRRSGVR